MSKKDLKSVSEVDLEPVNGGSRETDWKDARLKSDANKTAAPKKPVLEDGAD